VRQSIDELGSGFDPAHALQEGIVLAGECRIEERRVSLGLVPPVIELEEPV
jgi:hypothetical protein